MRAVTVHAFGTPETFAIEDRPDPVAGPGEVRVRTQACAVNYVDSLVAGGAHQSKPELPFTPGGEFAGIVDQVGPGVVRLKVGDRVCGSRVGGAYAELNVISADLVFRIPDEMDFITAATFRVSNATACLALVQGARLQAGETVFVLGANGAVGYAAVQIAKALGARVVGAASSEAKRAVVTAAGADAVIDSKAADWRDQLKAAAGGSIDVVIDPLGGDYTEPAFRSLGYGGRQMIIGFAAGGIPKLPVNLALVKGASLIGVDIRQFSLVHAEASADNMRRLFDLYVAGRLKVRPAKVYAFEQFAEAMTAVHAGALDGRAALRIAG